MPVSCGFVDEGFQEFRIRGAEGLEGLEFFQRENLSCPIRAFSWMNLSCPIRVLSWINLFVPVSCGFVDEDFRNSGLEVQRD